MKQLEALMLEVEKGRREIKTDSLSMSIGEIINLYKDGDLELTPAYQRLFRWDNEQKSRFVESIILGIPLPPIFVAQKEDGKWSVVDGLQRLSTILQLTNELIIEQDRKKAEQLILTTTKKLPSLKGLDWNKLPNEIKRMIKRSKLNINIILTENSIQSQYELFQRLNTGGLHLEPQEIRNCLIIMLNEEFYKKLDELKSYPNFINSLSIQDNKINIEHHMELILRYFIMKHNGVDFKKYNLSTDLLADFIDQETINLINDSTFNIDAEIDLFKKTFDLLFLNLGKNSFKKYNIGKNSFTGAFNASSYEAITSGIALNIEELKELDKEAFREKIKSLYSDDEFIKLSRRGVKALQRIKGMMDFSKGFFKK